MLGVCYGAWVGFHLARAVPSWELPLGTESLGVSGFGVLGFGVLGWWGLGSLRGIRVEGFRLKGLKRLLGSISVGVLEFKALALVCLALSKSRTLTESGNIIPILYDPYSIYYIHLFPTYHQQAEPWF